jgi:hypothetical protein
MPVSGSLEMRLVLVAQRVAAFVHFARDPRAASQAVVVSAMSAVALDGGLGERFRLSRR